MAGGGVEVPEDAAGAAAPAAEPGAWAGLGEVSPGKLLLEPGGPRCHTPSSLGTHDSNSANLNRVYHETATKSMEPTSVTFTREARGRVCGSIITCLRRYLLHHPKVKVRHRERQRVVQFE